MASSLYNEPARCLFPGHPFEFTDRMLAGPPSPPVRDLVDEQHRVGWPRGAVHNEPPMQSQPQHLPLQKLHLADSTQALDT